MTRVLCCGRCWGCSGADKRYAAFKDVPDVANMLVIDERALLIHEVRDEAGRHQRHVCEEQLEVRDAGALVHVHAVPAQPRVLHEDLHRFERGAESEIAKERRLKPFTLAVCCLLHCTMRCALQFEAGCDMTRQRGGAKIDTAFVKFCGTAFVVSDFFSLVGSEPPPR